LLRQTDAPRAEARAGLRLAVSPAGPSPNERPGRGPAFAYSVRQGDTLYALARACGVPMAELMRRNPALHGSSVKATERIWIPDLLPASGGEPAEGLAYRAAHCGEVRMSADRRFVAVLDSTLAGHGNSLTVYERKSGKRIPIVGSAPDQCWKRVGWSPDGRLLVIEGLRRADEEGGTLMAFEPLSGVRTVLLTPRQAAQDLQNEGHSADIVEIVSFRPIKDRLTYRLALRDDRGDHPLYTDWAMARDGSERRRA
jgi:hypothetical protein